MRKTILIFGVLSFILFIGAKQHQKAGSYEVTYKRTNPTKNYVSYPILRFNTKDAILIDTGGVRELYVTSIVKFEEKVTYFLMYTFSCDKAMNFKSDYKKLKKNHKEYPYVVKLLDDYKMILGYKCRKAEITTHSKDNTMKQYFVWFTNKLGNKELNIWSNEYNIKGLILEYDWDKTTQVAIKIESRVFGEADFKPPHLFIPNI